MLSLRQQRAVVKLYMARKSSASVEGSFFAATEIRTVNNLQLIQIDGKKAGAELPRQGLDGGGGLIMGCNLTASAAPWLCVHFLPL